MASLDSPKAVELLGFLSEMISVAGAAFHPGTPFAYPADLHRLPVIVKRLQPFLGREKIARVPFWNCVKALDERRKKLGLIVTLEEMVDRATSMQPSPMVRLLQARSRGKLSTQEEDALTAIDAHLASKSEAPPANLKACRSLLARVPSPAYAKLLKGVPRVIVGAEFENIMDYAAYLDFCQRNQLWTERYMATLEDLYGFLLQFDHDLFYAQLNRVLFGRTPKAAEVKAGHARYLAKERQREKRRKTKPTGSLPPPEPST